MAIDALGYRLLLVGRAFFLAALWGAVFGEVVLGVLVVASAVTDEAAIGTLLSGILFSPIAGVVGAAAGGLIGLLCGLALALSSSGLLASVFRARLVTGSTAAAVPLAVVLNLSGAFSWWQDLVAAGIATAAAVVAVLKTPRILNGPPPPARWQPRYRQAPVAPFEA